MLKHVFDKEICNDNVDNLNLQLPIDAIVLANVLSWSPNHKAASFVGIDKTKGCVDADRTWPVRTTINLVLEFEKNWTPTIRIMAPTALRMLPKIT